MKTVEILLYSLRPGTGHEFHQIMHEVSVPLHRSWDGCCRLWQLTARR